MAELPLITKGLWGGGARRVLVTCAYCRKKFWMYKSAARKGKKHYCCLAHYHANKSGDKNPNWRNQEEQRECQQCSKLFIYRNYDKRKERRDGRFCSVKCKNKSLERHYTEEEAKQILNELRVSSLTLPLFAKFKKTSERQLRKRIVAHFPDEYETVMENRKLRFSEVYRRGRAFETRTRKYLTSAGYVTMPSPRSMGPADLLAVKQGEILLIQCKLYGTLRKEGRLALEQMAEQAGGIPLLATIKKDKTIIFYIPTFHKGGRRKVFHPNNI